MAKLEKTLSQDFDRLLHQIEQKLLAGQLYCYPGRFQRFLW